MRIVLKENCHKCKMSLGYDSRERHWCFLSADCDSEYHLWESKEEENEDVVNHSSHYDFECTCGERLDPYRLAEILGITDHKHFHAFKKLIRAGKSVKPLRQDIEEVIMTLNRWLQMLKEE